MSLGQTMITLGMFILLIMTVISANRMMSENPQAQYEAEVLTWTPSIANDLIVEIQGKPFDQNVTIDTTAVLWRQDTLGTKLSSSFSTYQGSLWGVRSLIPLPDSSYIGQYRSITGLKDVDDYDGYQRILTYNGINGFIVNVKVYYVTSTAPDTKDATNKQYFKKIELTVEHPQYLQKVTYSALASY